MLSLIGVIIIGGIVGYVASLITRTDGRYGVVANILIGIVGSFLAGLFTSLALGRDFAELGSFTWQSIFWSLLGAIFLIWVLNAVASDRKRL